VKAPKSMKPGFVACKWCGDPTLLSTATGPRQKMEVCPACFKGYRPCTGPQRARVIAVVRAEHKAATGADLSPELSEKIADGMVAIGDYALSDELLHKYARRAVEAAMRPAP